MSHRVRGIKILKAVSSLVRLQILNLLFDRGSLSYTELMNFSKMNPGRDAGRFAYHLKFLLKADLVEVDVEARKYCLTELGKMVVDVADKVEKKSARSGRVLVRTSHATLEEFDANKIASSLMKEAKMPPETAHKVAKEAEGQLIKSKAKYITAPLVREVVNAILIEKGLEEDRNKLTRLGLPVHEVKGLIDSKSKGSCGSASVHEAAGKSVLEEYTLLNVFPRDIADAHISGALHFHDLDSWILRPDEIMHDLRFFIQNNAHSEDTSISSRNLRQVLSMASDVLLRSAKEITDTQTLSYFNVFVAPFARGLDSATIREILRPFILFASQHANACLDLEPTIPTFLSKLPAIGLGGEHFGKYGDFAEESSSIAHLVLEILSEESCITPMYDPKVIVKMRPEAFASDKGLKLALEAHQLAAQKGIPYLACYSPKSAEESVFSSSGTRLGIEMSKDWEVETLRAGRLGCVSVDIVRIACEAEGDRSKLLDILRDRLETATRALEIKQKTIRQFGDGLLPFLMRKNGNDQYLRLENCPLAINIVGLTEAVNTFCKKDADMQEKNKLVGQITLSVQEFTQKVRRKRGKRLIPALLPDAESSERLALSDIERFGFGRVRYSGTREKPFYSISGRFALQDRKLPSDLKFMREMSGLQGGGGLNVVELGEEEYASEELLALTRQITEAGIGELIVYSRVLTSCSNCGKSFFGTKRKCPSCGAIGALRVFERR